MAVRNVGVNSIGLVRQPSPQHESGADTIPINQMKFSTSTPIKSGATDILPADLSISEQDIDTRSISEGTPSSTRRGSFSSIDSENIETFMMNTTVIEQFQIIPSRIWERR